MQLKFKPIQIPDESINSELFLTWIYTYKIKMSRFYSCNLVSAAFQKSNQFYKNEFWFWICISYDFVIALEGYSNTLAAMIKRLLFFWITTKQGFFLKLKYILHKDKHTYFLDSTPSTSIAQICTHYKLSTHYLENDWFPLKSAQITLDHKK